LSGFCARRLENSGSTATVFFAPSSLRSSGFGARPIRRSGRPPRRRQRRHIHHETVLHIVDRHPVKRLIDQGDRDDLDVGRDPVRGAEIEHFLRLGESANSRPGESAAFADQVSRRDRLRFDGNPRPASTCGSDCSNWLMSCLADTVSRMKSKLLACAAIAVACFDITTSVAPRRRASPTSPGEVVRTTTWAPSAAAILTPTWPRHSGPTTPTFWPGATFQRRSGE